ncbi:amidohydrolase [Flammeovirgaceae bacterium SG7u.111]|nr:amidohydrolase [Flammeovirgaceae bacterium SG7u.132]WPO38217.1 amidohydrolase [Flammeovirgaceae bacterium SG7u.111]
MLKSFRFKITFLICALSGLGSAAFAQAKLKPTVSKLSNEIQGKLVEWRRDFHENPELSNREFKTAEKVAKHLTDLGLEVKTGIAHTGVVGVLKGGKPGPVVGLRADMDALPVVERVDIPFASKVKGEYEGREVGVMHACGHDSHIAILMGTAEVLSKVKKDLKGTVVFIFQPAEEGAPSGEEGGAKLMVKEGVIKDYGIEAVFGLHINSQTEAGKIGYKPGGTMASANRFTITVKGKQVHGAYPWSGIDPIVTSSQIIMGLQTIVSRSSELTNEAAVVSIGHIDGGVRNNIIPEEVKLDGTFRALDENMRLKIVEKINLIATNIAESAGATAEVHIHEGYPVTFNDPELTNTMAPSLVEAAGEENVFLRKAVTGAEDFSFFAKEVPGLFFFLGGMPVGMNPKDAAPHHTPDFYLDESGFSVGVKAFSFLTLDYMDKAEKMAGK